MPLLPEGRVAAVGWMVSPVDVYNRVDPLLLISPHHYLLEQIVLSSLPRGGCKKQPFLISHMSNNTIPQISFISHSAHHLFVTISAICALPSPFGGACKIFMNIKKKLEDIFYKYHNMICAVKTYFFFFFIRIVRNIEL